MGKRLTALTVSRLKAPGMYADGDGLYLQITPSGRSWIFRFRWRGRRRDMGLGPEKDMGLAKAREAADGGRKHLLAGQDPIEARRTAISTAAAEAAKAMTFETCAKAYIESHKPGWRNPKHAAQWSATLERYAYPVLGRLPVQAIDTGLVLKVLEPIWTAKTETAARVRGRIEAVLDWAEARGYRAGDNPARWRGRIAKLLPERSKVRRVEHHPAMPYDEIGAFMSKLRKEQGTAARALEFLILTATRTSETTGATFSEINVDKTIWIIPGDRIKAGKAHRVPLGPRALAIVKEMTKAKDGPYVFPGGKRGRSLSNNAMLALLERMGRSDLTVHGFRSTFRDWAAERTNYPREVAEQALAHAISDKVEASYRRSDLLGKRTRLMAEWDRYCGPAQPKGEVVQIAHRKRAGKRA